VSIPEDRELLGLAAKAAGYPIHSDAKWVGAGGGKPSLYMGLRGQKWNPLEDDGDALRLAVKLHLDICFYRGFEEVGVQGEGTSDTPTSLGEPVEANEKFGDDTYAAARRAIVRAAAEIGRSMP